LNASGYPFLLNVPLVALHNCTRRSMKGTSVRTPTTVASAAPEVTPKRVVATAIATSK